MGSYVELLKACKEGNSKRVKKLLSSCKNIEDVRDLADKTLLHYCFQNETCSDLILDAAPELLDVGEKSGYTVLHLASMMKPPTPLKYLLTKNPDINKKTNELRTPLLLAVIYDNFEAIKILCEANAEVNVTDCLGVSPLHYASKTKSDKYMDQQIKIIDLLLEHHAKIEIFDSFERTPLIWSVSSNNLTKMHHLLSKGANINAKDVSGLSILHYATSNGNVHIIESLLSEYNFDIEASDNNKCTSLMYGCTMNQSEIVQFLLEKGANVNAEDVKKRGAVHFACGKGDINILKILNDYNVDLWKFNEDLNFPLHEASFKGHLEIVKFLIEHHASDDNVCNLINQKNANGQTSLHLAAVKDHIDICQILLVNGGDPNITLRASNGKSMTALDLSNKTSTKLLIGQYNGKTADELINMCPIKEENTYSISELSDSSSDFDTNGSGRSTPSRDYSPHILEDNPGKNIENTDEIKFDDNTDLSEKDKEKIEEVEIEITEELRKSLLESSYKGDVEEIRSFVTKGVCLSNIVDHTGKTLLHYSIKNRDTFQFILELAPECVNKVDDGLLSVLNLAIMSKESICVEMLLENNADFNLSDHLGRTSLHLAVIYDNIEALRIINKFIGNHKLILHKSDDDGRYPLHYAVELYKSKGSDHHCKEFIELLLAMKGDIECRDNVLRSPLLLAVNINNMEAVSTLLEHGADILAVDNHNLCSTHYACSEGNLEIFNDLSKVETFDPDIPDQNGLTPIFYAVASCNEKIIQRLLQLNAKVDISDKNGRNLCHKAAEKGAFKCLELLLLAKVDPWLKSKDGTMPLHEATYRGYKEIVEILLNDEKVNVYINVKNISGQTALHLAAVRNDCPMCFLLINKGSSVNELLYDATHDVDVTAYDLATTPYCKETLHTFGGRSAKRILNNASVEEVDNANDEEIYNDNENNTKLSELLKENSINETPYSVRSTEFDLSTMPSVMNNTTKSTDKLSNKKGLTPKMSSLKSETPKLQKGSYDNSIKSLVIPSNKSNCRSVSTTKDTQIVRSINYDKEDGRKSCKSSRNDTKPEGLVLSLDTSKSISNLSSSKSVKNSRSILSKSRIRNEGMQSKIQSSILNYEFIRLNSKVACEIARQQIRRENVEKLINPKTPKILRRTKLT